MPAPNPGAHDLRGYQLAASRPQILRRRTRRRQVGRSSAAGQGGRIGSRRRSRRRVDRPADHPGIRRQGDVVDVLVRAMVLHQRSNVTRSAGPCGTCAATGVTTVSSRLDDHRVARRRRPGRRPGVEFGQQGEPAAWSAQAGRHRPAARRAAATWCRGSSARSARQSRPSGAASSCRSAVRSTRPPWENPTTSTCSAPVAASTWSMKAATSLRGDRHRPRCRRARSRCRRRSDRRPAAPGPSPRSSTRTVENVPCSSTTGRCSEVQSGSFTPATPTAPIPVKRGTGCRSRSRERGCWWRTGRLDGDDGR